MLYGSDKNVAYKRKDLVLCAVRRMDTYRLLKAPVGDRVSNVNVNDNGKLNLDKSNVDNDNSTRALMMTSILQTMPVGFYANRLFVYEPRLSEPVI